MNRDERIHWIEQLLAVSDSALHLAVGLLDLLLDY